MRRLALLGCLLTVCITAASAFIRNWQAGPECVGARCGTPAALEGNGGGGRARAGTYVERKQAHGPAVAATDRAATGPIVDGRATPVPVMVARFAHRVAAMVVGFLAILLSFVAWSRRTRGDRAASAAVLALTLGLSWLGRHTPSVVPMVTLGNVLGGFLLAAAFAWIAAGAKPAPGAAGGGSTPPGHGPRRGPLSLSLVLLLAVAAVGVMIGARDAVGACALPICVPEGLPGAAAFDPRLAEASVDRVAQQWLHLAHRGLALAAIAVVAAALAVSSMRGPGVGGDRTLLFAVAGGVVMQAVLGAAMAAGAASAPISAMHNAGAALLVAALAAAARRALPVTGRPTWRSS